MFTFLLVVHALVAATLVGVILIQRSEGGGLTSGGNPGGLMSARGAADFLTRATAGLATIFIIMSIGLAAMATMQNGAHKIDTSLARKAAAPAPAPATTAPAPATPAPDNGAVPLAH